MNKKSSLPVDYFSFLSILGLSYLYRNEIISTLNNTFFAIFGKTLSGRNIVVQIAVFGSLFITALLIPLLLNHLSSANSKFRYIADFLLLIFILIPTIQLARICANQVLRRDDFWEIADAVKYGFSKSIIWEIKTSSGRYLSWTLKSLHAVFDSIPYINTFLFLNLILAVGGASCLAHRVLTLQINHKERERERERERDSESSFEILLYSLFIGFLIVIVSLLMASNVWEVWFWGAGGMIYGIGISLCISGIALILSVADHPDLSGKRLILPILFCFLNCGASELCTASFAAFVFLILMWKRIETGIWDKRLLLFFLIICLCIICVFSVSGSLDTAVFHKEMSEKGNGEELLPMIREIPGMLRSSAQDLWAFIIIKKWGAVLPLFLFFIIGTQLRFSSGTKTRLIIISAILVIIAISILLINKLVHYTPPRVYSISICWIMIAAALLCFSAGSFLFRKASFAINPVIMMFCALFLCLAVNHFYQDNIEDLRNTRESWIIRDAILSKTRGTDKPVETCSLPVFGSFRDDILPDQDDDFNIAAAKYYQIPSIYAVNRCPPYGDSFTFFPDSK